MNECVCNGLEKSGNSPLNCPHHNPTYLVTVEKNYNEFAREEGWPTTNNGQLSLDQFQLEILEDEGISFEIMKK